MSVLKELNPVHEKAEEKLSTSLPRVDYLSVKTEYAGARFLRECCMKLNAGVPTMCVAATYYHKFFSGVLLDNYDPYLIASTCIYLASKVKNDDLKIRDIINVGYHSLHSKDAALSLDPYFELRDSLVETELLLMRMLKFDLHVDLPHKYLLFFLNALKDWVGEDIFAEFPIVQMAWTLLLDSYHLPVVLKYTPPVLATSAIYLTFQIYGIQVPGSKDLTKSPWFCFLHPDCKVANILNLTSEIMKCYLLNNELKMKS